MSAHATAVADVFRDYLLANGVSEPEILARLRRETAAMPMAIMQISPEQGCFMALLTELLGVRRYLEIGTFTGYSSLAVALAMPPGGRITALDVSEEWTAVARRYWREAGVEDRIAGDFERIWGPLERLFETVAGVMRVDVAPLGIADGAPGTVISQLSVVVIYQLDSAVITA